jgi:elongator complex protein 3
LPLRRPSHDVAFDPHAHRRELAAILEAVGRAKELDARALDRIVRRHPKRGSGLFSKSEIIAGFRALGAGSSDLSESDLLERLRLRPVRTLSGVTPVTVLTRPHPCPGACIFCPSDVRMPKSYLADEPGAQRAEDNGFDPYLQTWNRLAAYRAMGHPVDKAELIVLGGTWSAHPEAYQVWFVTRCLDALSDFGDAIDARAGAGGVPLGYRALARVDGHDGRTYNDAVGGFLRRELGGLVHPRERAGWDALGAAQARNERAGVRCVGLSLETRPDHVSEEEVLRLRRLGATKIQLGVQHVDDEILARNDRGHDSDTTRRAFALLRAAGFKLQAHFMPNLLGASPERDVAGYARLFEEPALRPDELKLYPCMLVESAALAKHHARGEWQPYGDDVLLEVVTACMAATPRWCRLTRVIRDFSAHDIAAGTHTANLREVAERRLAAEGRDCVDIRAREIRGAGFDPSAARLRETRYATSAGEECFLEQTTPDDRLVAFLRLSLPTRSSFAGELGSRAVIRELHVYGASLPLGARRAGRGQHAGLGRALVDAALSRAITSGYAETAVISAVGTRDYYRALGFRDGVLYQHR